MKMNRTIAIVAALLFVGFGVVMIRHNAQDARNKAAIQGAIQAVKGARPGGSAEQNARFRQQIDQSRAGTRFRQSQRR
jgi:hypothetical protein